MNESFEIFTLNGFLKETLVHINGTKITTFSSPYRGNADYFTYSRIINEDPATGYPAVRVGLGWFTTNKGLVRASFIPNTPATKMDFYNSIYSQMVDVYTEISKTHPKSWAEKALMTVGYAAEAGEDMKNAKLFAAIPAHVLEELRNTASLHETAFLLHITPNDQLEQLPLLAGMLKRLKQEKPDLMFTNIMEALKLGLPAEELEEALALPEQMFKDLYLE